MRTFTVYWECRNCGFRIIIFEHSQRVILPYPFDPPTEHGTNPNHARWALVIELDREPEHVEPSGACQQMA